jgi:hypothetical protein
MKTDRRCVPLLLFPLLLALGSGGCASVQPWERESLALTPMAPEGPATACFDRNVEVYREGAAGANGGKSGGGCGCT